ncbi:MAG: lipopolysaccharide biosynthesis protein [Bacteroidetes bacterium]|nr:lipopolysaccharide biosynthesis protein [Bacteroidota bacterium]
MALRQIDFFRDTFKLLAGTVIAQALPLLLQPVLSRIFTTSDYAIYGVYFSIISWFDVISTGRYELAVTLPEKDEDAINLVGGGILISIVLFMLMMLTAFFFHDPISALLHNPGLSTFLYLMPFTMLIMALGKMLNIWLIRKEAFKQASYNKVTQKAGEVSADLGFGLIKFSNGLILGDLFGRICMGFMAYFQSVRSGFSLKVINIARMKSIMSRHRQLPLFNSIPALMNTSATLFPVLLISSKYAQDVSGSFNFTRLVLMVPMSFLAYSISQVLFQRVTKNRNAQAPIRHIIIILIRNLGLLALILFVIIFAGGPQLFSFIFGKNWHMAGEFARIMVFSFSLQFLVSPLSITLAAMEKIRLYSLWQVLYFFAIGSLFLVPPIPVTRMLILLTAIEVFFYLLYFVIILRVVRQYEKSLNG